MLLIKCLERVDQHEFFKTVLYQYYFISEDNFVWQSSIEIMFP